MVPDSKQVSKGRESNRNNCVNVSGILSTGSFPRQVSEKRCILYILIYNKRVTDDPFQYWPKCLNPLKGYVPIKARRIFMVIEVVGSLE